MRGVLRVVRGVRRCGVRVRAEVGPDPLRDRLRVRGRPRRPHRRGGGLPPEPDVEPRPWRDEHPEWWEGREDHLRSEAQYSQELEAVE